MMIWDYQAVRVQQEVREQVRREHLAHRVWAQRDACERPLERWLIQVQCALHERWSLVRLPQTTTMACTC